MTNSDKRRDDDDDSVPVPQDGTHSVLSGSAASNVVQARDVSGGVHFHRSRSMNRDVPRQLLGDVRGFVNRLSELERLERTLLGPDPAGLTVIVGTAGVGKTALALRWAHRAAGKFPDGQLYVNLRGYDPGAPVTAGQALERFLRALGTPSMRIPDDLEAKAALYRSLLAGRHMIVVLDNAAHVSQLRPLLPGSPTCRVIATSRDRLEGLMAHDGAQRVTLEILPEGEAIELIRRLTADYRTSDNHQDLAELARLCARLPLALRIAAERAASRPWMPMIELIRNLRDESRLWDALSAGNGEESDGVQAVFAWSYRAFSFDTARMFRLLGLHPGPEFGVHVASEAAGLPVATARQFLDSIVGAHMLEQTAPDRYQFHDLLRAYATDAVHHEEPLEQQYEALARMLAWYLHTVHAAGATIRIWGRVLHPDALPLPETTLRFHDRLTAAQWFDLEWPNVFAAIRAADKSGLDKVTWQLTLAAEPGFRRGVSVADRQLIANAALHAARRDGARQAEGELVVVLAEAARVAGRANQSALYYQESLSIFREIGDRQGERITLNSLGVDLLSRRQFDSAIEEFGRLVELQRAANDTEGQAAALFNLADACNSMRRYVEAVTAANLSLELGRQTANPHMELVALTIMARAQANAGEVESALDNAAQAVEIARNMRDLRNEGWVLLDYARIQRLAGRHEDALVSYQRAASVFEDQGIAKFLALALDGIGNTYRESGRARDAIPFNRQAVAVAREEGSSWDTGFTLANLAESLTAAGVLEEAIVFRDEAIDILRAFDDPETIMRLEQFTR